MKKDHESHEWKAGRRLRARELSLQGWKQKENAVALGVSKGAVLVVDEMGFLKKGTKSVGVAAQYTGRAGKIANCQVGVFPANASRYGAVLLDRELYLHREWGEDPERCREADVPEGTTTLAWKCFLFPQPLQQHIALLW
jgi:SRSO17 transposase